MDGNDYKVIIKDNTISCQPDNMDYNSALSRASAFHFARTDTTSGEAEVTSSGNIYQKCGHSSTAGVFYLSTGVVFKEDGSTYSDSGSVKGGIYYC
jgi:hypothetical protein